MTVTLGIELKSLVEKLIEVLVSEPDVVKRQQAIELLTAMWAARMDDQQLFVADSIHKHVRQILHGWQQETQ